MEVLFGLLSTSMLGYLIAKLEKMEEKVNHIENELIALQSSLPKRTTDGKKWLR